MKKAPVSNWGRVRDGGWRNSSGLYKDTVMLEDIIWQAGRARGTVVDALPSDAEWNKIRFVKPNKCFVDWESGQLVRASKWGWLKPDGSAWYA